ncbi:helix-turn-helix domain-containing protein [Halocella sp. SP3-1]|uniref:helix-turn-helix domain-containing protein n=1 Tax=Halocella sp. SP3-1 TaxID=2382161 RepID=UPI002570F819|nr:helix-turn-helix domain-containing protein [Halocella sp. SP3-1]
MRQTHYNIQRKKGKHLTLGDRKIIAYLYNKQGKNYTEIAREMNCHRTTISREIKKGITILKNYMWRDKGEYIPEIAQGV